MIPSQKENVVKSKIDEMSEDAKMLHKIINQRNKVVEENEQRLAKENKERHASLLKIQKNQSSLRTARQDAKELERQKLSRTLMANLVTAADYPDAPPYVPHMINMMQNILGTLTFNNILG